MKDLIVVASHGSEHIADCLESLTPIAPGTRVAVLHDGGAMDWDEFRHFADRGVDFVEMPFKGYTTGKFLWAYWHFPATNYFFMQDSMRALRKDFLVPFRKLQPNRGAVAWCKFKEGFDSDQQKAWADFIVNSDPNWQEERHEYPGEGIFGDVFYTNRETLDALNKEGMLPPIPTTKLQAQGMERVWPWIFDKAGMIVESVSGYWDAGKMERGELDDIFSKVFADRK